MSISERRSLPLGCNFEGCIWRGGSTCVHCGRRLRCGCGRFVREDHLDQHIQSGCPLHPRLGPDPATVRRALQRFQTELNANAAGIARVLGGES